VNEEEWNEGAQVRFISQDALDKLKIRHDYSDRGMARLKLDSNGVMLSPTKSLDEIRPWGYVLWDDLDGFLDVWLDDIKVVEQETATTSMDDDLTQDDILSIARSLVYGDRQADYGHPKDDMDRTAKMWSAVLGHEVTAEQVALCMCCVKISRQVNRRKRDNLIDLAGYAAVADRIVWKEDGEDS
jgi:hypothetical protein